jgi:hypothetical protein
MSIYWRPFRLYKGRVAWEHGLLVEMLRNTEGFWDAYTDLLALNGKRESDIKELHHVMKQLGLTPNLEMKDSELRKRRALLKLDADLSASLKRLNDMFSKMRMVIIDDETLMYSVLDNLRTIYLKSAHIEHLPDYMLHGIQDALYGLMKHMAHVQEHAWVISKAHSRGAFKFAELTIVSSRGERRRIRRQTIELDHIRNRIAPLQAYIEHLRIVKSHDDIHELHEKMTELLHLYHEELTDLSHILHEADILVRRTEMLFKAIEHEAHSLGIKNIENDVHSYAEKFHKILLRIEDQARRETREMYQLLERLPEPGKMHAAHSRENVVELAAYRKQHEKEQIKKAA